MATLPLVKVQRLYRQISELLIQKFKDGEFKPGTALPAERDLAEQLGVSRSSVREALIALEIAGWVNIKTGHGVFICDPSPESQVDAPPASASVGELLNARELIEGETARLAAEHASDEQLQRMRELMEAMEQRELPEPQFLGFDEQFHLLVAEMADNSLYTQFVKQLWDSQGQGQFVGFEDHYGNDRPEVWNVDHRAISAAILARDAAAARAAMQQHIRHIYANFFDDGAAPKASR